MENEALKKANKKALRSIWMSRITGIICSLGLIAILLCFYFHIVNEWVLVLSTLCISGVDFVLNAIVFDLRESTTLAKANMFVSAFFFISSLIIIIYGLISGQFILV